MTGEKKHLPGHLAISASAGSGKTTRLTERYIRLLADRDLKLTPGRICALTFTRKAAGEIFDRIVEYLCDGAATPEVAAGLAERLGMPGLDERDFGRLLRVFLDHLHRAVIGTIDSFVFGVARSFPVELGIPMAFQATDPDRAEGRAMRQEILADIIAAPPSGVRGAREFFEAFKRATFGTDEKSVAELLDRIVTSLHMAYRLCPDKTKWGNAKLIWTGKNKPPSRLYTGAERAGHAAVIAAWIDGQEKKRLLEKGFADSLRNIVGALAIHDLAAPWNEAFGSTLFGQLLAERDAFQRGNAVLEYRKKQVSVQRDAARALAALTGNLVAVEIRRAIEKTAGLRDLLEYYDLAYEKESRESGRFSFSDIQYLLAMGDTSRNALKISRENREGRLFIDYRMDARLDHWLLDEFQDTSDLQWAIFSNLVSELVQGDPDGRERSFFYVGDVKQSIYRWRGGNPGLFLEIQRQYNRVGRVIRQETMANTYRCSPPVVEAVNKVFSNLPSGQLPARAIAEWQAVWSEHESLNKKAPGCAVLLQHADADDPDEARRHVVAGLLNEIQPARRGLGVGILVHDNKACTELVNVLRRECPGVAFVHEGKAGIVENELAQALLALVRAAAHPGDDFAWQHIRMSPLAPALAKEGISRDELAPRLLAEIEASGFQSFIEAWGSRLERVCALNQYGRLCLARLEKAAAVFDSAGSRSCNRFQKFAEDYVIEEESAPGCVRIMTVHQAKGLGFDVVILPQLQHRSKMNMTRAESLDRDMLFGGKPFDPTWVLKSPKSDVAESDPILNNRLQQIDEDRCFDWLCFLYVAMTRARNALYMITSPVKKGKAFRPASLLKLKFTGETEPEAEPDTTLFGEKCARLYSASSGDERWYERFPMVSAPAASVPSVARPTEFPARKSRRQLLERSEPSKQDIFARNASDLFDPEARDVLDFGSAIHELFKKIEWLAADADPEAIIADWRPSQPYDAKVREDVLRQFRRCVAEPSVRRALARPPGRVELWPEKSFEIVLDGQFVSGVFDRVVIARSESGEALGASILDFKSNRRLESEARIRETAEHYRPQMDLYRRALAGILHMPAEKISLQLLFTVPARLFPL